MAFYDVISKKLSEKSQEAYQYGRNVAGTVKYNSLIADEEKYINSLYSEIGQMYLDLYQGNYHDDMIEKINLINNSFQRIEEYRFQLSEASGFMVCPNCGNRTNSKASFCSVCGSRIIKKNEGRKKICPACHSSVGEDDDFCMECGQVLKTSESNNLKRCPSCHAVIKGDMAFCIECGFNLRDLKDENGDDHNLKDNFPEDKKEIDYKGDDVENIIFEQEIEHTHDEQPRSNTPRFCIECGTPLESDDIFCTKCGKKVEF